MQEPGGVGITLNTDHEMNRIGHHGGGQQRPAAIGSRLLEFLDQDAGLFGREPDRIANQVLYGAPPDALVGGIVSAAPATVLSELQILRPFKGLLEID